MTRFRFVEQEKARYPVRVLCTAVGVSPSGYYAWRGRGPSAHAIADEALAEKIRHFHRRSRGTYGVPRIWADLAEAGHHVSRKRVARLMKHDHLAGVHRRRFVRTTIRDEDAEPFPDLVDRELVERMLEAGHERANFAIVDAAANAASPHHEPSARVIADGHAGEAVRGFDR